MPTAPSCARHSWSGRRSCASLTGSIRASGTDTQDAADGEGCRVMTVLVTGSSGHLGEALVRTLAAARRDVIGIDIRPGPFTHRTGSVTNRAFVGRCMEGVVTVFHAATLHKPHV